MDSVARYKTVIESCAKICQLKREIEHLEYLVGDNLTLNEIKCKYFANDDAIAAFKILDKEFIIEKNNNLVRKLIYKNISIGLHENINESCHGAMRNILQDAGIIK